MSFGAASTLRLVAAAFRFCADLCEWTADAAAALGDPEIATPVALVCVGLACSGRYLKALFALLVGTLLDLLVKQGEVGYGPGPEEF